MTDDPPDLQEEAPDIHSSTDAYAQRFAGPIGAWMLQRQNELALNLLGDLKGLSILDVGGGHAQLAPLCKASGARVTVLGSSWSCRDRLRPHLAPGELEFVKAPLLDPPYPDNAFDLAIAFRMLPHLNHWTLLIRQLCRIARQMVLVDFPSVYSFNRLGPLLFHWKKQVETNTRPYQSFRPQYIKETFETNGFPCFEQRGEFVWPMAMHRLHRRPTMGNILEAPFRKLALVDRLGSPVILSAKPSAQASPSP